MASLDGFLDHQLSRGQIHFTREEFLRAFSASSRTLTTCLSKISASS